MIAYEKMYVYSPLKNGVYRTLYNVKSASYRMFLITSENDTDYIKLKNEVSDDKPMYVLYPDEKQIKLMTAKIIKFRGSPILIPVNLDPSEDTIPLYDDKDYKGRTLRSGVVIRKATVVSHSNDGSHVPDFLISNPLAIIRNENIDLYTGRIASGSDISKYIWKLRNTLPIHSFKSLKKKGEKK